MPRPASITPAQLAEWDRTIGHALKDALPPPDLREACYAAAWLADKALRTGLPKAIAKAISNRFAEKYSESEDPWREAQEMWKRIEACQEPLHMDARDLRHLQAQVLNALSHVPSQERAECLIPLIMAGITPETMLDRLRPTLTVTGSCTFDHDGKCLVCSDCGERTNDPADVIQRFCPTCEKFLDDDPFTPNPNEQLLDMLNQYRSMWETHHRSQPPASSI